MKEAFWYGMLAGFGVGLFFGVLIVTIHEDDTWKAEITQGLVRASADHKSVEEWHAPLKPGDAGWWEVVK